MVSGFSPSPGPSSSDLPANTHVTTSFAIVCCALLGAMTLFSAGFYFSHTVPAEESVYSLQALFIVRMTDYSQGNEIREDYRDSLPQSLTCPVTQLLVVVVTQAPTRECIISVQESGAET